MSSPSMNPVPTPTDAPGDEGDLVTISRWELDALKAQAAGVAADTTQPPAPNAEEAKDARTSELERAYKAAVRDRELATALAGRPLVPGAAAQLIKLWREDFDVYEEAGEVRVAARDGRSVAKAVAERLAEGEYAHFTPAPTRGGASPRGMGRVPGPDSTPAPRTLGEVAIQRWREAASARTDPSSGPIGLRRR